MAIVSKITKETIKNPFDPDAKPEVVKKENQEFVPDTPSTPAIVRTAESTESSL